MNAKMAEVKSAFEAAGFTEVKTLLASGNVLFTADKGAVARLQADAEAAMQKRLGRSFLTFVRPVNGLRKLLDSDPYEGFAPVAGAKRIATFLRDAPGKRLVLPIEKHGARILTVRNGVAFGDYLPDPKAGPLFMALLEKTFGKAQTTRTLQTLEKVVTSDRREAAAP